MTEKQHFFIKNAEKSLFLFRFKIKDLYLQRFLN
jgi:hypothetical protein